MDDGWPESVQEQFLFASKSRHYITRQNMKDVFQQIRIEDLRKGTDFETRQKGCRKCATAHTLQLRRILFQTDAFAHSRVYTQHFCTQALFHTQPLLNTDALHTDAFTHRLLYTQTLLHTDFFTHKNFYTRTHTQKQTQ